MMRARGEIIRKALAGDPEATRLAEAILGAGDFRRLVEAIKRQGKHAEKVVRAGLEPAT